MSTSKMQSQIAQLQRQNRLLQFRLQRLEALLATTDSPSSATVGHDDRRGSDVHPQDVSQPPPADTQSATGASWTRRALLVGGAGAAAGGLVNLTTGTSPAMAAAGDPVLAGRSNAAGNSATSLTASSSYVLGIFNDRSAGTALYGETRSGAGIGVRGLCRDGTGVLGVSINRDGVRGVSDSGPGVRCQSSRGPGVQGQSEVGPGIRGVSDLGAALRLSPGLLDSVPQVGSWESGDFVVTRNDEIWLHSGGWRLLASPQSTGAYVPITPARVYDSRNQQPDAGAILVGGTQRVINVAVARNPTTGAPQARVVPLGTRAVAANVTITGTTRSGYVALTPGVAPIATSSAINWTAPQTTLANGLVLTTDTLVQLKAWVVGGNTHLIIDVMGYFGEA